MRRALILMAIASLTRATSAAAYPLDLDLDRLGMPEARGGVLEEQAARSRLNFALLSSELALAITSLGFEPPDTLGTSGFEVDLETAYAPIGYNTGGSGPATASDYWPTRGPHPGQLFLPALHLRKGLPWSFEVGGRAIWISRSGMVAAQGEVRWALHEGIGPLPDVAVRAALTHLYGQRDLSLTTTDLDLTIGKRFGISGVANLTPFAAARLTWMRASTESITFDSGEAAFPELSAHDHHFLRAALGLRVASGIWTATLAANYLFGQDVSGGAYPSYRLDPALAAALSVGVRL